MQRAKRSRRAVSELPTPYLTRRQVAGLFGVSPATVSAWARQGRLSFISTLGRHRRYRSDDILALLEAGAREARPAGSRGAAGREHRRNGTRAAGTAAEEKAPTPRRR